MKSNFRFTLAFSAFAIAFSFMAWLPSALAGTCAYNQSNFADCCVVGSDGYRGYYCDPSEFVQLIGLNPNCTNLTQLQSRRDETNARKFTGFNCMNNNFSGLCQNPATQCYDPNATVAGYPAKGACITYAGPNATCEASNKTTNCDQSCGACKPSFISCLGQCITPKTGTCGTGYVLDQCTGLCSCGANSVPSGVYPNTCVSFPERFKEILDYGLAPLGGLKLSFGGLTDVMSYAYASIGKDADWTKLTSDKLYYGKIFVEVDQADHVNWSSPSVPNPLRDIIGGNDYIICDPTYSCPSPMVCTAGICNNPTNTGDAGDACTSSSGCHLGLNCVGGVCVDPNAGLTSCTSNSQCVSPKTCVLGYCRNQSNSSGSSCSNTSDCGVGLTCVGGMCTSTLDSTPTNLFVGLSASTIGSVGGYSSAKSMCSAFPGSHVCDSSEMIASTLAGVPALTGKTGKAWVNAAVPSNIYPAVNDCKGWTDGGWDPFYGAVWDFDKKAAYIQPCAMSRPFACCK